MNKFAPSILIASLVLTACTLDEPASSTKIDDDSAMKSCPVIDSRNWSAWVDAEPPGPARLHIRGQVDMPTPGYTTSWRLGIADRAMPPGQHIHLDFTPPDGIVTQVITSQNIAYEDEAAYPGYRVIYIHCGDDVLAEITDIPIAM